jgi:hypothetical protein
MHEIICKRGNDIIHGNGIDGEQELASHLFVAFYTLCDTSLAEDTWLTDSAESRT